MVETKNIRFSDIKLNHHLIHLKAQHFAVSQVIVSFRQSFLVPAIGTL